MEWWSDGVMAFFPIVIPNRHDVIPNIPPVISTVPPVISTVGRNLHGVRNLKDLSCLTAVRDDKLYDAVRDDIFREIG